MPRARRFRFCRIRCSIAASRVRSPAREARAARGGRGPRSAGPWRVRAPGGGTAVGSRERRPVGGFRPLTGARLPDGPARPLSGRSWWPGESNRLDPRRAEGRAPSSAPALGDMPGGPPTSTEGPWARRRTADDEGEPGHEEEQRARLPRPARRCELHASMSPRRSP